MPITWRVMLSPLWDMNKYREQYNTEPDRPEIKYLPQSKGRCKMVKVPLKGDIVYFVLKGKIVMEGSVETDGFIKGDAHRNHSCNIGDVRIHATTDEYAICKITSVTLNQPIARTGQRTWQQYNA